MLNGPAQDAPDTTTLLTSDKVKEDPTKEILRMNYKYGRTYFNHLQSMATNGDLPKLLAGCPFPVCAACING